MKNGIGVLVVAMTLFAPGSVIAVELLIQGDFERLGWNDAPLWDQIEFLTGSDEAVNSAEMIGDYIESQLRLRAFAGGGPFTPAQGNFDGDGLPAGEVDGRDFLTWQRGYGYGGRLSSQGDATGDGNVDCNDLSIWQDNYGRDPSTRLANARISQTVPAAAGETYSFQGTSTFEEFYSGFVTTLGDASPHGQIASPTTTQFRMDFLNSSGVVLGSPTTLDLRSEQLTAGVRVVHSPLIAVAPPTTTAVRVVAEALNMAWNGTTASNGAMQSAYFDDFALHRASQPQENLLWNGELRRFSPDLEFWNQVETPPNETRTIRSGPWTEGIANHTPMGTSSAWFSPEFGAHPDFEDVPVDGTISQMVNAVAGGVYSFSAWSKFESNYSGGVDTIDVESPGLLAGQTSPTQTKLILEFLDISENVISSSVIDVEADRELQNGMGIANTNCWCQHSLENVVAPAGTEFVRLSAQMIDGVFNIGSLQSAYFDDFSLDGPVPFLVTSKISVPEPTAAGIFLYFTVCSLSLRCKRISSER